MPDKTLSKGKCVFCNNNFPKNGITRHLNAHLVKKEKESKAGKSFHVKVEPDPRRWGKNPYFLNLWVNGNATMDDIDDFLRHIWLECCGHLSGFSNAIKKPKDFPDRIDLEELAKKSKKEIKNILNASNNEIPYNRKTKDVLHKDIKLNYDYDYGSTTSLQLTVAGEYPVKSDKRIVLLSRNEPQETVCSDCGEEAAIQICTTCMYHGKSLFCKKCGRKHAKACSDFAEYAALPVVNSPRMGVCGYTGGTIDIERDVWIKPKS